MFKTLKPLTTILTAVLLASTATAANPNPFDRDDGYPSFTGEFKNIHGILMNRCFLDEDETLDFCDPKMVATIKKMVDRKPVFGKNRTSVLMRFWDEEMNAFTYAAYNKQNNKLFFYPHGLTAVNPPHKAFKVTYGKNVDRICTSGYNTSIVGDSNTKSYYDRESKVDYCRTYNEETGFGVLERVDTKTRKIAKLDEFKL